jgi:hypothetical protein
MSLTVSRLDIRVSGYCQIKWELLQYVFWHTSSHLPPTTPRGRFKAWDDDACITSYSHYDIWIVWKMDWLIKYGTHHHRRHLMTPSSKPYLCGTACPNDHNKDAASTERAVPCIYWCGTRATTMVNPPKCHGCFCRACSFLGPHQQLWPVELSFSLTISATILWGEIM